MTKLKRLVFGVLSSLLFTFGFAVAADYLDPVSQDASKSGSIATSTPDCSQLCDVYDSQS